jgi:hypothetical protein
MCTRGTVFVIIPIFQILPRASSGLGAAGYEYALQAAISQLNE